MVIFTRSGSFSNKPAQGVTYLYFYFSRHGYGAIPMASIPFLWVQPFNTGSYRGDLVRLGGALPLVVVLMVEERVS